ncbi:WG repeat-containing protein [Paenibacillus sp. GYB003]|uniref:WG repeat-containing protein n=1 Tax=Paenibacillus sp. GYB003 TaxID=2994392 RepID=UPI002F962868
MTNGWHSGYRLRPAPVYGTVSFPYGGLRITVVALFGQSAAAPRLSANPIGQVRSASASAAARPAAPFLYPVAVKTASGNLWGYIDESGRIAVAPQFDYAYDFQPNRLAIVQRGDKQGAIDLYGRYVVRPIYDSISPFSEGRSAVIDGQGFKVIDDLGHPLTPKPYGYIGSYREGRAVFAERGEDGPSMYGYLDLQGKEAIPARFSEANDFADGKAVVRTKDGEYALIDPDGTTLASYPYAFVGNPGDGLLAFRKEADGKYGYMDEKGNVVIPPRFTGALPFEDGYAIVDTGEDDKSRYGLIGKTGAFVIRPEYDDMNRLGEGRVAVGKAIDPSRPYIGSTYALADTEGRLLTDFRFSTIGEFDRGYASVSEGESTYWIDRGGRRAQNLPALPGSGTMAFDHDLIRADVDQRLSYFDKTGKQVWKPNAAIPLTPPYVVREVKYKPNQDYLVYYPQIEGMTNREAERSVNDRLKRLSAVKPVPPGQQPDASYTGDFAVLFARGKLLVLELDGYHYPFGAAHGMPSKAFVHIDLDSGATYGLSDLFKPGSSYVKRIGDIVRRNIETDPKYSYVFPGSFKEIAPDQLFYVTDDALHILFPPYEIAPYATGFPEFVIPFSELADIVDPNGAFWKSFHGTYQR